MFKTRWLWIVLVLLLILSLPGILDRWNKEAKNDTYEITVPFHEVAKLTAGGEVTLDHALSELKEAGLNNVSFRPLTLDRLRNDGMITIYKTSNLEAALLFRKDLSIKGYYITIPDDPYFDNLITANFKPEKQVIGNQAFYFLSEENKDALYTNIGYNDEAIEKVKKYGFHYTVRVENNKHDINEETIATLVDTQDPKRSTLLFSGQDIIGYPDLKRVKAYSKELNNAGYNFYSIEFTPQKGLETLAKTTNYPIVRLHSLNLNNNTLEATIDRAVRAVKERNIRSIFFHIKQGDPVESLANATDFINGVHNEMPDQFTLGIPKPFEQIHIPLWNNIILLVAGILFTFLAADILKKFKVKLAALGFVSSIAILYLLTGKLVLLQGFALIIAIITPIYAVLSTTNEGSTKLKSITLNYLKAIGISFIGILLVVGLLNGNAFITGFELFRGVKLVYIIPILFVFLFLFWRAGLKLLNTPVKYWHLIVFLIICAAGLYYITRTGNAGSASNLEMMLRQTLEELLYVRPRTKEFLIGFPFYILAIYVMGINKSWGKFLLIPGVIGFLSIMNTFTHFHIPLHVSLLRTAYSLIIGYFVGILLIYVFKISYHYIQVKTKRWS